MGSLVFNQISHAMMLREGTTLRAYVVPACESSDFTSGFGPWIYIPPRSTVVQVCVDMSFGAGTA
jgi:hypothetical protein